MVVHLQEFESGSKAKEVSSFAGWFLVRVSEMVPFGSVRVKVSVSE